MKRFFPFISASTTILSLFLCLFGITAFSNMLTGNQWSMWQVEKLTETLPNPLEFVQDSMKIFNAMMRYTNVARYVAENLGGGNIFTAFVRFVVSFISIFQWIVAVIFLALYVLVIGPLYCAWFLMRSLVVAMQFLGVDMGYLSYINGSWNFADVIINALWS